MKNRALALLLLPLGAIVAVGACAVAGHAWESKNSLSAEGVQQLIDRELPPGSTKDQIIEFLEDRHIDYSTGLASGSDPRLSYTTPFVRAVFRNTCPQAVPKDMFATVCDITVTFELSTRDELQDVFIDG